MKKLLGILVLGLLLSSNAYAEIILKNCGGSDYEKNEIKIDKKSKKINTVYVYTDEFIKTHSYADDKSVINKINVAEFDLVYIDDSYAKGERTHLSKRLWLLEIEIEISLKNKIVYYVFTEVVSDFQWKTRRECK